MAKVTKTTFKSFIKKNQGNLYIKVSSKFDGMVDCVMPTNDNGFAPVQNEAYSIENTLGIQGVWLVGQSRDYFTAFEQGEFECIEVSNCCGSFTIAARKAV